MARYPTGVKTFIPQIQPYQVDFNFANNVLKTKQNQYDTNWKQLNKLYGQIYYADLTRGESKEKQEALVKQIDFNLKRISTMDLSLDQNVQAAKQIFQPFYEDKNLMKDIAWTKNTSMQLSGAESLRNSSDEEQRARYWQDGVNAINYRVEEFKEMPYDQIQSAANARYTPYVDVMAKADEISKEFGDQVRPSFEGGNMWIMSTTNGELLRPHLQKLFQLRLANDPAVQDLYKTQAYVDRKNYMYQNADKYNGDKDAAERDYLNSTYDLLKPAVKDNNKKVKQTDEFYRKGISDLQKNINEGNQTIHTKELLESLSEGKSVNDNALILSEKELKDIKEGKSTLSTSTGFMSAKDDLSLLRTRVDSLRANQLMRTDFTEAADVYAFRNFKQEIKENPYEFERVKQQGRMALAAYNQDRTDARQSRTDRAAKQLEIDKYRVETAKTHTWAEEPEFLPDGRRNPRFGDLYAKPIEELNNVYETDNDLASGKFDMKKSIDQYAQSNDEKITGLTLPGLEMVAGLGLDEETQKKFFGGMTLKEAMDWSKSPYSQKGTARLEKIVNVVNGVKTILYGDNDFAKLASDKYSGQDKYDSYSGSLGKIDDQIAAHEAVTLEQVKLNKLTKQKLADARGNNLASLFVTDIYGNAIGEENYIKMIEQAKGIGPAEIEEMKIAAQEAKEDGYLDILRQAEWEKGNYAYSMGIGLYDAMDLNELKNIDLRDAIPFWSLAQKKDGIPTYADAIENYNKFYKKEAETSGNAIFFAGKIGSGSLTGSTSKSSTMTLAPKGVSTKNHEIFFGGAGPYANGITKDIGANVDIGDTSKYLTTITGIGLTADDPLLAESEDGRLSDSEVAKILIRDLTDKSKIVNLEENIRVEVSPTTAFDGNKAAYTFFPGDEDLKKYVQTYDSDGNIKNAGIITPEQYAAITQNGISILSDQVNFSSSIFEESYSDQVTMAVKASPDKKYVNNVGSYSQVFQMRPNTEVMDIQYQIPDFDVDYYLDNGKFKMRSENKDFVTDVGLKSTDQLAERFRIEMVPKLKQTDNLVNKRAAAISRLAVEEGWDRAKLRNTLLQLKQAYYGN